MMNHIYQDLEDHDSVKQFENIRGVSKNIFFIQHHVPEVMKATKIKLTVAYFITT